MKRLNVSMTFVLMQVLAIAAMTFAAPAARAADSVGDLQKRSQQRDPKISALKSQGKIGETFAGYVEPVNGQALAKDDAKVVGEENADRTKLYQLIAEKRRTTVDEVGKNAAVRNFQDARSGEYLKGENGEWAKKK